VPVQRKSKGVAIAVAALLASGVLTACSSSGTPSHGSPSGDAPSSSLPQSASVQQAVAAYRAMWVDMEAAATTSDPSSPRLADHASGAALRLLQYGLSKNRQQGLITKGSVQLSPEVANTQPSGNPTRVDLRDCSDDSHWLLYKRDGSLQNDVPGGHYAVTATVQLTNGRWSVTHLSLGAVGSC
jgi:hypothetical protein